MTSPKGKSTCSKHYVFPLLINSTVGSITRYIGRIILNINLYISNLDLYDVNILMLRGFESLCESSNMKESPVIRAKLKGAIPKLILLKLEVNLQNAVH